AAALGRVAAHLAGRARTTGGSERGRRRAAAGRGAEALPRAARRGGARPRRRRTVGARPRSVGSRAAEAVDDAAAGRRRVATAQARTRHAMTATPRTPPSGPLADAPARLGSSLAAAPRSVLLVCAALFVGTLLLYGRAATFEFVNI